MAHQYRTGLRDAQNDLLASQAGASAKLYLRTGTKPASCADADSGSLLATLTLPSTWMAASSGGVVAKTGTWTGTASGAGDVGHFRIKDNAGTNTYIQGSVTATGGGGDMTLDNITLANGQTVTINTFQITRGNA